MKAIPAVAGVGAIVLYSYLFLHAESQAAVLGLVGAAVLGVPVLGRLGWLARVAASLDENRALGRVAIGVALVAVVALFRDQHFAMLMVASVLFYTVAC